MKLTRFLTLLLKTVVVFTGIYIAPALVATCISLDLTVYKEAATHPAYVVMVGLAASIITAYAMEAIAENKKANETF